MAGHPWKGLAVQSTQEVLRGSFCCRWQFSSEGGDIGFGIFVKTRMGERQKAGEMAEVLPSQRYNAHMVPEDGSLTCLKAGVCKRARFSCSCLCERKTDSRLGLVRPLWSSSTSSSQGKSRNCTGGLQGRHCQGLRSDRWM